MDMIIKLVIVEFVSFGLNVPLGMWRVRLKKFSLIWFISIHLAVPLIYFLRVSQGLPNWTIPISIVTAILGQIAGGLLSKKIIGQKLNFPSKTKMGRRTWPFGKRV